MKILCAPDSLKGVLAAADAAAALAAGAGRAAGVTAEPVPLADGGEGTAETLAAVLGGDWRQTEVHDPLGRSVVARFVLLPRGGAVVESAEAVGLWRLEPDERDPLKASSRGVGELIAAAVAAGGRDILVTLGGSATVDGGAGMRDALAGCSLDGVRLRAACDVTNPLLGERGAARVFGPQKGASPEDVEELERRLAAMEELRAVADRPGAGAAGGLGAALAALGAELVPGIELVLDAVGFADRLDGVGLVVTGEGRVDETSAEGKVPGGVVRACVAASVPCAVFGGLVDAAGARALYGLGAAAVLPLSGRPERAHDDLVALGEALGRLGAALQPSSR